MQDTIKEKYNYMGVAPFQKILLWFKKNTHDDILKKQYEMH